MSKKLPQAIVNTSLKSDIIKIEEKIILILRSNIAHQEKLDLMYEIEQMMENLSFLMSSGGDKDSHMQRIFSC